MTRLWSEPGRDASTTWSEQPLWWSERQRSKALLWPHPATWFVNDPLGPQPHTHPAASEVYVVASGVLGLTVGRDVVEVTAGGYCYIPPSTFHAPSNTGREDLLMLAVVAPKSAGQPVEDSAVRRRGLRRLAAVGACVGRWSPSRRWQPAGQRT